MCRKEFSVGRELPSAADIQHALDDARGSYFDSLLVPIVHPRQKRGAEDARELAMTRSDMAIKSSEWRTTVYGHVSPWIDLDSRDPRLRRDSEKALRTEIEWCGHLGMSTVVLPTPASKDCHNYARVVYDLAGKLRTMKLLLRVPLVLDNSDDEDDSWEIWNTFRNLCEHHPLLAIAAVISPDLPNASNLGRWFGEPMLLAILPTSVFLSNQHGYPVLSKAHQRFVSQCYLRDVKLICSGSDRHNTPEALQAYVMSLYSYHQAVPPMTERESFERPYYDYLQAPLQPLMDNLESGTYEVFEKDPVKYRQYEEAIYQALLDRYDAHQRVVIMVVGAGRGPLVKCSLRAAERSSRNVFVFAVEKNPNAVITLRNMHEEEKWTGRVEIVASDMRVWKPKELADILVSELLGSFGDNELSPECLDGAQDYLKRGTGISIPYKSVSYLSPITSERLYNEVKGMNARKYYEMGYVVRIHNAWELDEPQECFTFTHPNYSEDSIDRDNSRYADLMFEANANAMIHGFAGYFEAMLYKDVMISIHPPTFSEGMFSWFPIYWPLRSPVPVKKGDSIRVNFWRVVGPKDVWYEWSLSEPESCPIHNPSGRSYKIGL